MYTAAYSVSYFPVRLASCNQESITEDHTLCVCKTHYGKRDDGVRIRIDLHSDMLIYCNQD